MTPTFKPLIDYWPCEACLAELQGMLTRGGAASVAGWWCDHREVYATWNCGQLQLSPCTQDQVAFYQHKARLLHQDMRGALLAQLMREPN